MDRYYTAIKLVTRGPVNLLMEHRVAHSRLCLGRVMSFTCQPQMTIEEWLQMGPCRRVLKGLTRISQSDDNMAAT